MSPAAYALPSHIQRQGNLVLRSPVVFISAAMAEDVRQSLGIEKQTIAVKNTHGGTGKSSMIHHSATPEIEVAP